MSDFRIDTRPYQPPPQSGFWRDVWKITLGVCFGTLLASVIAALLWWGAFGLLLVKAASNVKGAAAAADKVSLDAIFRVIELVIEYERLAAGDADESEKATAADRVAAACRAAKNLDQADFWEKSSQVHRAAAAAGKRTRPRGGSPPPKN